MHITVRPHLFLDYLGGYTSESKRRIWGFLLTFCRSAQRDLGLKVELVESWTGDKIKISEDFRESEDIPEKWNFSINNQWNLTRHDRPKTCYGNCLTYLQFTLTIQSLIIQDEANYEDVATCISWIKKF